MKMNDSSGIERSSGGNVVECLPAKAKNAEPPAGGSAFLVRVEGLDLPCGAGRLAAPACRRHAIHSRSGSSPCSCETGNGRHMASRFPFWDITLILIPNAPRGSGRGAFCAARGAFSKGGVHFSEVGCSSTNWNYIFKSDSACIPGVPRSSLS